MSVLFSQKIRKYITLPFLVPMKRIRSFRSLVVYDSNVQIIIISISCLLYCKRFEFLNEMSINGLRNKCLFFGGFFGMFINDLCLEEMKKN